MAREHYCNFVCLDAGKKEDRAFDGAIYDFKTDPHPLYSVCLLLTPGSPRALEVAVGNVRQVCDTLGVGINCLMFAGHGNRYGQFVGFVRSPETQRSNLATIVSSPKMRAHVLRAMAPLKGLFRPHSDEGYSDGKIVLKGCNILGGVPLPEHYRKLNSEWGSEQMVPMRLLDAIARRFQIRAMAGHSKQFYGRRLGYHFTGEFGVSHHKYGSRWNLAGVTFSGPDGEAEFGDVPEVSLIFEVNPAKSMLQWKESSGRHP